MSSRAAAVLALLALANPCATAAQQLSPPGPAAPYVLREVASWGWEEMRADAGLDERTRAAGGGVLGRIVDLQLGADGRQVFVLDNVLRKVVSFDARGTPRVLVSWQAGRAPGELIVARSFTLGAGAVTLLDRSPANLSVFSLAGEYIGPVPFRGIGLQLMAFDSGYAVTQLPIGPRPIVLVIGPKGTLVDSIFPASDRLAEFTRGGMVGRLYRRRNGEVGFASPAAGRICSIRRPVECRGVDLFPAAKAGAPSAPSVPIAVAGAAELASGETVILVNRVAPPEHAWLVVLDGAGQYRGYVDLGAGTRGPLIGGPDGTDIIVAEGEPYPRVVRYRLVGVR